MKINNNIGIKQYSFLSGNMKKGIKYPLQRQNVTKDTFQSSTKVKEINNADSSNPTQNLCQNSFSSYPAPSFQGGSIINKPFSSPITKEEILEKLKNIDIPQNIKDEIISNCDLKEQRVVANKFLSDENLYNNQNMQEKIGDILNTCTTPKMAEGRLKLINKYLFEPKLYENNNIQEKIGGIIYYYCTPEQADIKIKLMDKYISESKLHDNKNIQGKIGDIICYYSNPEQTKAKIKLIDKYISDEKLYKNEFIQKTIGNFVYNGQEGIAVADKFLSDENLYENKNVQKNILDIIKACNTPEKAQARIEVMDKYISDEKLYNNKNMQEKIWGIIYYYSNPEQAEAKLKLMDKYISDEKLYNNKNMQEKIGNILYYSGAQGKLDLIDEYISESKLHGNPDIQGIIGDILSHSDIPERKFVADKFLSDEKLYNNQNLQKNIGDIVYYSDTPEKSNIAVKFLSNEKLYENKNVQENILDIIKVCDTTEKAEAKIDLTDKYILESKLYNNINMQERIGDILNTCETREDAKAKIDLIDKYISESKLYTNKNVQETIGLIIASANKPETTSDMIQKSEIFSKLVSKINNKADFNVAVNFVGLYEKKNIYEIPICERRNVINKIIKNNSDLFQANDDIKKAFPLIPTTQEEYCKILPALVKSLGIETNPLTLQVIGNFNLSINKLANALKKISDNEFYNMTLTQKYSKDNFIKDTSEIIKKLPENEQKNLCNLFGFELRKTPTGYSISGYPTNPFDGKKFAGITDKNTKEVIEKLKEKVIAFTQENTVYSNNSEIESVLNGILSALPELHKLFDDADMHKFDIMKHSLMVMKNIVENKDFETLNNSDKKVMLLVALLHDITKNENTSDLSHSVESSFDAFYITRKFNLTKDEQLKMYNIIRNHEWLKYVNQKGLTREETTKRLQSVAFDFQNDNIFNMVKIFTRAELESLSPNNKILPVFNDEFFNHSKQIDDYIYELKKTNPILPTTKLPKASEIASKITYNKDDCSTNIKGLYQKDGLIIIKYNEVEDWEAICFPKGSKSRGIELDSKVENKKINTGNIKFIAHGLDYKNQLTNFDSFALPDSDALLSVSYMERPESKYRLFRQQGVLLDVDSKYIYGGGEADSGSGYKKSISKFKARYTFGGVRERDRKFISDLIKTTLNLNDEEYIKFIEENQNKSFLEIEPVETREKLIKQFALINSNTRRGNREYNEMYVSNPKVQGVFAYDYNGNIGEISNFIANKPAFLIDYAKNNDLPFFVFGD